MAGLFGGNAALAAQAGGSPMTWADRLAIIGAGLKDASPGSEGGNLMALQALRGAQAKQAQDQQLLARLPGLFGGQAQQGAAPVMTDPGSGPTLKGPGEDGAPIGPAQVAPSFSPPPPSGPDWGAIAAASPLYKLHGIDLAGSIEALKAGQPNVQYDRGFGSDSKTGRPMGGYHPELDKGQEPLFDANGRVAGVRNIDGSVRSAAEMAGAVAGAQEGAKASLDLVDVPRPDGSTIKLPRDMAVRLLGGMGGAPGGPGGGPAPGAPTMPGFGVTQTPAAAELAKARAGSQGKNEADIAGARSAMQQVDDQTNMIAQNLHDMLGETQDPNTGAWVKTKPSMVTGLSTGSGTDLIEHVPFLNQQAKDLAAKIETVRNGTSFNSMQAIKSAMAAAGDGGSGSMRMTDQTARMLGEINGSLQQNQSGQQFEATLRRHLDQLNALAKDRHTLFESQYRGVQQPTPGQTGPTANYGSGRQSPATAAPLADRMAEARRRGLIP